MSHFSTLLTHVSSHEEMERQLLPFAEDTSIVPEACLHFEDLTDAYKKEYEKEGREFLIAPNGQEFSPWDMLTKKGDDYVIGLVFESNPRASDWALKETGWTSRFATFAQTYDTFEEFCADYHSAEPNEEGLYGYTSNANAKWDYFSLGGRWTGYFRAKERCTGSLGISGVFENQALPGHFDWMIKREIDFDSAMNQAAIDAAAKYVLFQELVSLHGVPRLSGEIIEEIGEKNQDQFRELFWNQPIVRAMQEKKLFSQFCAPETVDAFGTGSEEAKSYYVETARLGCVVPYSILHEGQWYQRGQMGWFGFSNDAMTQGEWVRKAWSLIESLPDTNKMALVDCHI